MWLMVIKDNLSTLYDEAFSCKSSDLRSYGPYGEKEWDHV